MKVERRVGACCFVLMIAGCAKGAPEHIDTLGASVSALGTPSNPAVTASVGIVSVQPAGAQASLERTTWPLIGKSDLEYVGAFRVPRGVSDRATLAWGGTALAFNSAANSLIMAGHDHYQFTVEISIPELTNSTSLSALRTAVVMSAGGLGGYVDALEGKLALVKPSDPAGNKIGGHLVVDNRLYLSAFAYYDGSGSQVGSHYSRPLSLEVSGEVKGPAVLGERYAGYVSGYMTHVPSAWVADLGGSALTGNAGLNLASFQSNGPGLAVFDPRLVGDGVKVAAPQLAGYPLDRPLAPVEQQNDLWNFSSKPKGVAFPQRTRSILVFGRHGSGPYCYGDGGAVRPVGSTEWCYDPAVEYKGIHAYPYVYKVWAFDVNDLIKVRGGKMKEWEVRPYAHWTFSLPFQSANPSSMLGGAAYDAKTDRVYISQLNADGDYPIIHAFRIVRTGVSSPQ